MSSEERRAYYREYRRRRRALGLETMGNDHRESDGVRMVLTPWRADPDGMSRELRGVEIVSV